MSNHGDGPIQYGEIVPCPPTNPQVTLSVPPLLLQGLSDEQRLRVAKIQINYAQRVSRVLLRSYGEILAVLGGDASAGGEREESK